MCHVPGEENRVWSLKSVKVSSSSCLPINFSVSLFTSQFPVAPLPRCLSLYRYNRFRMFEPLTKNNKALIKLSVYLTVLYLYPGTYKSEENQLLLKVYQVKGPTEHYYSKFKNDNWAMDGYVRKLPLLFPYQTFFASCQRGALWYGYI